MNKKLSIVKIGGHVIDDHDELDHFLKDFSAIQGPKVLVHGGGKWVSVMSERMGLQVKMIEGRRVTDAETLEVVKMMLPGVANKNIVAGLQKYGCNALGFTGADGNTIRAVKRPVTNNIDFGYVGDIARIDGLMIYQILGLGLTPVFTAMTHDGEGQMLNTNADTIASSLAVALSDYFETELYFCFEKPGVMADPDKPETVIPVLTRESYVKFKKSGAIHSGMIPKIDNAFGAIDRGVSRIHICHYKDIGSAVSQEGKAGTLIMNH